MERRRQGVVEDWVMTGGVEKGGGSVEGSAEGRWAAGGSGNGRRW